MDFEISPGQVKSLQKNGETFTLLDVRESWEYEASHIEGAKHIHIEPIELLKPHALELVKGKRANFEEIAEYCRSPKAFLKYLDHCGVDRAALINYVAPEVMGFTPAVNQFVADYTKHDPKRLISCASLHPPPTTNLMPHSKPRPPHHLPI